MNYINQITWYACIGWDFSLTYIEEPSGVLNELTRFLGTKSTVDTDAWKLSTAYKKHIHN